MGVARARPFGHTKWATLLVLEWHLRGLGRNCEEAHVTIRPPPILHGRVPLPPPPRSTRLHASPRGLTKTEDLYLKHPTHLRSPASRPLATRKEPRTGAEIEYNAIINQSISPQGRWALASALLRSDWAYRAAICHGLGLGQARPDGAAVELYICGPRREGKVRSGRMMMIPSSPDAA